MIKLDTKNRHSGLVSGSPTTESKTPTESYPFLKGSELQTLGDYFSTATMAIRGSPLQSQIDNTTMAG